MLWLKHLFALWVLGHMLWAAVLLNESGGAFATLVVWHAGNGRKTSRAR